MWLLAQAATPGWETYGPLGLLAAFLLTFAGRAYKREADRADRLESELREFLPRLLEAVAAILKAVEYLERHTERQP